jgi:nucleoside-diphosphate-sugar epimerase
MADASAYRSRSSRTICRPGAPETVYHALANALVGWEPKVALRDGLVSTLDYFRELTQIA